MKISLTILTVILVFAMSCGLEPRNTLPDCREQCQDSKKSKACMVFCDCIHKEGQPLDKCLEEYDKAPEDSLQAK